MVYEKCIILKGKGQITKQTAFCKSKTEIMQDVLKMQ
jgi:hypothetical protein